MSKKRSSNSSKKLKGIQTLTPAEQEAADIMKALKESKKMSKRQPGTGGSNEGTGNILGVPDESTCEADMVSEHFDRDDNVGDDNEETNPDPEEMLDYLCQFHLYGLKVNANMTSVRHMASLTGGLEERNSTSQTSWASDVKASQMSDAEFSVVICVKDSVLSILEKLNHLPRQTRSVFTRYQHMDRTDDLLLQEDLYDCPKQESKAMNHMVKNFSILSTILGMVTRKWYEVDKSEAKTSSLRSRKRLQIHEDLRSLGKLLLEEE
ncbi:hypothetical protein Tco_0092780 [Tanacetum coccineum]